MRPNTGSFYIRPLVYLLLILSFSSSLITNIVTSAEAAGSLIVDPAHPQWLKHEGGNSFFLCGPGDPENFLYRGTRNANGTRSGDQMALINKLAANGGNSIYFQMIRSHGGDDLTGTHNPFIDSNPALGLDLDILNQWESWFTAMDQAGILIYAFFYDDSARIWGAGSDNVPTEERAFLEAIVTQFKQNRHLVWVIAEEYQEALSATRLSNMAAIIRAVDENNHPIGVHKLPGLSFSEFANDPNLDQFAIQRGMLSAPGLHGDMVTAFNDAAGRYNLNMAESAGHGTGATARMKNWAVAMGGAYVMVFQWDIAGTATSDLQDCGRLVQFMETTNFAQMTPRDDLAFGGTQYVLADPTTDSYILYASALTGDIGILNGALPGSEVYDLHWMDIPSGTVVDQVGNTGNVLGSNVTFTRPSGIGPEMAVWVRPGNNPPEATDDSSSVNKGGNTTINVVANDTDADGTIDVASVAIVGVPPNGTAMANPDGTVTYTHNGSETTSDSFTYTVQDNAQATSNIASVTITVNPVPPGSTESLTITQFEFRADKNEWRIEGMSTIPGPGNTMTLYVGPTVAGSPVLGTAAVSNLGNWEFRERNSSVNPHSSGTISIQSSQGGTWEGISGVGPAASSSPSQ